MRLVADVSLLMSEDVDQLRKYFDLDTTADDTVATKWVGGRTTLAALASNQQVMFTPELTNAKWIIVMVYSGLVTVKLNSTTAQAVAIKPLPAVSPTPASVYQKKDQPGVMLVGPLDPSVPITTLYLSNPSGTTAADCFVAVLGEAA